MPVVDLHSHLMAEDLLPARWWDAKVDLAAPRNGVGDREALRAACVTESADPTGERLLASMIDAGIDHQVVFPVDFGVPLGDPPTPIRAYNERVREFQSANPDRVTAFVTIDPRRPGSVRFVDDALGTWAAGLKLHPAAGFDPADDRTLALVRVAADHDVPVLFHTGRFPAPLYSEPCHPIKLDAVLAEFPDVDIVAAHLGFGWWRDLLEVAGANAHTGLRVGLSGWQPRFADDPDGSARVVRRFVDTLGPDRVHFATDYPVYHADHPPGEWVRTIRSLAERDTEPTFSPEEIDAILGGGAASMLDLG